MTSVMSVIRILPASIFLILGIRSIDAFINQGNVIVHQSYRIPAKTAPFHLQSERSYNVLTRQQRSSASGTTALLLGRQHSLQSDNSSSENCGSLNASFINKGNLLAAAVVSATAIILVSPTFSHAALFPGATTSSLAQTISSSSNFFGKLTETGFYQAFSLVFLSEIGDKTFFIAGLLAMKTSRFVSYVGSMGALIAMTAISVVIGQAFHAVPAGLGKGIALDDLAAVAAFTFFGLKTLKDALEINDQEGGSMGEELAEAEEVVEGSSTIKQATAWAQIISTFGLVFAAEFGDRSFLSTIALSAAQNPLSVAGGAIAAHGLATGLAVFGGSYIAKYISEKIIGLISGTLFLVFAFTTALGIF